MYVAVVSVIAGQALIFGRLGLWLYAAGAWLTMAAFVRLYEEPTLRAQFRCGLRRVPAGGARVAASADALAGQATKGRRQAR